MIRENFRCPEYRGGRILTDVSQVSGRCRVQQLVEGVPRTAGTQVPVLLPGQRAVLEAETAPRRHTVHPGCTRGDDKRRKITGEVQNCKTIKTIKTKLQSEDTT